MQYQTKSIVSSVEHMTLPNQHACSLLHFHTNMVLAVTQHAIGLYRDAQSITDPLGNGLLAMIEIPENDTIPLDDKTGHVVVNFDAGFVSLGAGRALLIKPHCVEYYPTPMDGLQGQNMISQLMFPTEKLFS